MRFLALALMLCASPAKALISVMEGLPTTKDGVYIGTTTPQLILNATSYNGTVPTVSLYASSNVVVGSNGCVLYSTGTIYCLGVRLSTTDPAGTYVPYTGATADVNLGTHKSIAAQFGAGTSPASNFLFDGLSAGAAYARVTAGTNLATGYYWGGTRGYSMQERYDLTGTPFTLHDELNNVDRFSLDTSGEWYYLNGVTVDSFTSLGAVKGGSFLGVSGATETTTAALSGVGTAANPLGVASSSVAVLSSGLVINQQIDHSSVPFLVSSLINNSQIDHSTVPFLVSGLVNNSQVDGSSVTKGGALVGSATLSVTPGTSKTTFNTVGITSNTTAGNYLDQIHVTNGIIDGGVFAASGGGANVFILNSSQTVSGANTNTGSWTSAAGSSVTVSPNAITSFEYVFVASADFNQSFNASLPIPATVNSSSCTFKANYQLVTTTTTAYWMHTFNGNVSGKFATGFVSLVGSGGAYNAVASALKAGYVTGDSNTYAIANGYIRGSIEFETANGSSTTYHGEIKGSYQGNSCGANLCTLSTAFVYSDGTPISSIRISNSQTIQTSAPDNLLPINGHLDLYRKGYCHQ